MAPGHPLRRLFVSRWLREWVSTSLSLSADLKTESSQKWPHGKWVMAITHLPAPLKCWHDESEAPGQVNGQRQRKIQNQQRKNKKTSRLVLQWPTTSAQQGMRGMTPINHPTGGLLYGHQSLGSFPHSLPIAPASKEYIRRPVPLLRRAAKNQPGRLSDDRVRHSG